MHLHIRRRSSVAARSLTDMQSSHNCSSEEGKPVYVRRQLKGVRKSIDSPDNRAKNNCGSSSTANTATATTSVISPERSNSNPGCKPEDHSESFYTTDSILVGEFGESSRSDDEVCDDEKGPDGGKEHEINAVWRLPKPWYRTYD